MSEDQAQLRDGFILGAWTVYPDRGLLQKDSDTVHLEPKVMDVLLTLVADHGRVVSRDQLVDAVWDGRRTSDDAIAAKIGVLRNRLGDDSRNPTYIETVQKRGYRLKASATLRPLAEAEPAGRRSRLTPARMLAAIVLIAFVAFTVYPDPIDSIGIVPFQNLSADRAKFQYTADGFTEELMVSLGRVPELRIRKGVPADIGQPAQDIAKQLGVDAVISGSLRTDGDKLRITVAMTDADGYQLWARNYDGKAEEIFDFQVLVANYVREETLGVAPVDVELASKPANKEAGDAFLLGLSELATRNYESLQRADDLFRKTNELDPAFGRAYLRRAVAKLLIADYEPARKEQIYDEALAIARQGALSDPGVRDAIQLIPAFVNHQRGNWAEAEDAFAAAFESDTVFAVIHHWYSRYLGDLGLVEDSLQHAHNALSLEPDAQVINSRLAIAYLWNNDLERAQEFFEDANSKGEGVPDHYLGLAVYMLRVGRLDDAREAVRMAFQLARRPTGWVDAVFDSLVEPDDVAARAHAEASVEAAVVNGDIAPYVAMTIWMLFGDADRAMDAALSTATATGAIYELEIVFIDEFKAFREHDRFPDLLDSLGVTRHWQNLGCEWRDDALQCAD